MVGVGDTSKTNETPESKPSAGGHDLSKEKISIEELLIEIGEQSPKLPKEIKMKIAKAILAEVGGDEEDGAASEDGRSVSRRTFV